MFALRAVFKVFVLLSVLLFGAADAYAERFKLGVHYFPGWKDNQIGAVYPLPWEKIKPYPEREPLLGWYREGDVNVMEQQLTWMKKFGIDYVVFDWYWSGTDQLFLDHALNAFLQAPNRNGVQFAIMWANHTDYVFSREQFESLFRSWAQGYMLRPDYLRLDGKPVVYIFSADILNKNAAKLGMTSAELLGMAEQIFSNAGLVGISFIGGTSAMPGSSFDYSAESGYAGFSAYNFHGPATFSFESGRQISHSFQELDDGYRDQWKWILNNSDGLYVVPMTSGWDKRPWGGSADPLHDLSVSTPETFELHLRAAKAAMNEDPLKTRRMGLFCCWNEFGEGSYIEPTKKDGFAYLQKIRMVFYGQ
jgi:hypothetical protein